MKAEQRVAVDAPRGHREGARLKPIVRRGQGHEDRNPTRTHIDGATLIAYVITY
jgi:hypothetical protein